ncbi:phosphoribosylaminoimidazole carboxylase [Gammaproteobacteria bacterium SCGC AG-212-F23]|nr:phosphoribosylaminoimidazole carboxylase [Gammaproteobacteria bacterium SCGC AG-212-F23]
MTKPLTTILMGSKSDWPVMEQASLVLTELNIPHEARVLSAHRTPDELFAYVKETETRGTEVIIAAAGGAAHLPGVIASKTLLPVIGVPMESVLDGIDSLLSIAQMPAGIPVATMAIGKAGAVNSALFAAAILSVKYSEYRQAIQKYREKQAKKVLESTYLKEL